jgi:hypothetical protein
MSSTKPFEFCRAASIASAATTRASLDALVSVANRSQFLGDKRGQFGRDHTAKDQALGSPNRIHVLHGAEEFVLHKVGQLTRHPHRSCIASKQANISPIPLNYALLHQLDEPFAFRFPIASCLNAPVGICGCPSPNVHYQTSSHSIAYITPRTCVAHEGFSHVIWFTCPAYTSGSRNSAIPARIQQPFVTVSTSPPRAPPMTKPATDSSRLSYSVSGSKMASVATPEEKDRSGWASTCSMWTPEKGSRRWRIACTPVSSRENAAKLSYHCEMPTQTRWMSGRQW